MLWHGEAEAFHRSFAPSPADLPAQFGMSLLQGKTGARLFYVVWWFFGRTRSTNQGRRGDRQIVVTRWDEKAGLRRDAVRSQVIDALEAQEIKETGNEED